jgi:anti-sigma factor RsiW
MELNFDKEIDALLRQSAQSGGFVSNQTATHLDADEISAFAENALPEKTKQRYMTHLADCDKCRKTLSNIIVMNAETESETVHHPEEKTPVEASIPWYRKLFAVPNLAYTLGALVLVFSGIAAYTVLQSVN